MSVIKGNKLPAGANPHAAMPASAAATKPVKPVAPKGETRAGARIAEPQADIAPPQPPAGVAPAVATPILPEPKLPEPVPAKPILAGAPDDPAKLPSCPDVETDAAMAASAQTQAWAAMELRNLTQDDTEARLFRLMRNTGMLREAQATITAPSDAHSSISGGNAEH